jgi:TRAP-type C4-dicarboxylate transport system permease small subunit
MGGRAEELNLSNPITLKGAQDVTGRLLRALAAISGAVLFLIMCLVSYAVFRRYVMNDPVLGDAEIVQIGMSLVVMMAMPYATANGAHIRVDIFDRHIGAWGRFLGDVLARSVGAYILFLLIQKTWDKALDAHEYGDVTNMIEIPVWIAYGAITIGMGGYAAVLVVQLLLQLLAGVRDYE